MFASTVHVWRRLENDARQQSHDTLAYKQWVFVIRCVVNTIHNGERATHSLETLT